MIGLNLVTGMFVCYLAPSARVTPGGWTIYQSNYLQNCVPHRLVPPHWVPVVQKHLLLAAQSIPSVKCQTALISIVQHLNLCLFHLGLWVDLDQVVPKERNRKVDPGTEPLVLDKLSPLCLRHFSCHCFPPEGNISRGFVCSNPIVVSIVTHQDNLCIYHLLFLMIICLVTQISKRDRV